MSISLICLGTCLLFSLFLCLMAERLSANETGATVILIIGSYIAAIIFCFTPVFDLWALIAAITYLFLVIIYFVCSAVASELKFKKSVRTGTWKFPIYIFYKKCLVFQLNDPNDPEQLKRMQEIVEQMLRAYKMEEAYIPKFTEASVVAEYYMQAKATQSVNSF